MAEEIITRHGGFYDGGETGLMDPPDGQFIRQARPASTRKESVCAGGGGGRESNPPTTRRAVHRF